MYSSVRHERPRRILHYKGITSVIEEDCASLLQNAVPQSAHRAHAQESFGA